MAEQITLFDVSTGEYVTKDKDPDLDWSINGDQWKYGTMPDGSTVRIDTTVENWRDYGGMKAYEDGGEWTFGYQAPDAPAPPPSWEEGLQGNLGTPQDPPTILQPTPPVVEQPVVEQPVVEDPFAPPPPTNVPTDDWFDTDPPGYENAPQPGGDGSFVEGGPPADTSWDWDFFREKAPGDRQFGGYDPDYQAFERYQPGMDSPWGMPNIAGNNEDFYQQQFVNMLRDEQGYQNRERAAQGRRQDALNNPAESAPTDWSWANAGEGLKDVNLGTGQTTPTSYEFNKDYAGQSLGDIWGQVQGKSVFDTSDSSKSSQDVLNNYFNNPDRTSYSQDVDWSSFASPGDAFAAIDPASWQGMNRPGVAQEGLRTILNQVYTPGQQGATAPIGYASPV